MTAIKDMHAVLCPYCAQAVEVRRGRIVASFKTAGHTVFVSTEYKGAGGIEHHCDVLRHAMNEARQNGSQEAGS